MKNLKIEYVPSYTDDRYQAVAINTNTHHRYIVGNYASIDRAVKLAPIALKRKIEYPSSEFERTML